MLGFKMVYVLLYPSLKILIPDGLVGDVSCPVYIFILFS